MPAADVPLTAEAALAHILTEVPPPSTERIPLETAAGRILTKAAHALLDSPPFTNSARDGYAVRAADLRGASAAAPVSLPCRGTITAGGAPPPALAPGHAVKVMTGGVIPAGADAVVMRENVRTEAGKTLFFASPAPGEHVRPQGEDFKRGDALVEGGTALTPWHVALLASQGLPTVDVCARPRAAVIVTGDEITPAGEGLRPGALYDANGPALIAALTKNGAVPSGLFQAPDDLERLKNALIHALARSEIVLVSGGVSVGDRDHTRAAFAAIGARELFWRVAIRPGGPLLAAAAPGGKLLFGLPGNPLSALVCFEEFVRPALRKIQGLSSDGGVFPFRGRAAAGFKKPAGLRQYLFVRRDGDWIHIPPQGSALLRTAAGADALAVAPLGVEEVRPGDELFYRELP
jgi:molybdopterin molybdotransferase